MHEKLRIKISGGAPEDIRWSYGKITSKIASWRKIAKKLRNWVSQESSLLDVSTVLKKGQNLSEKLPDIYSNSTSFYDDVKSVILSSIDDQARIYYKLKYNNFIRE